MLSNTEGKNASVVVGTSVAELGSTSVLTIVVGGVYYSPIILVALKYLGSPLTDAPRSLAHGASSLSSSISLDFLNVF